MLMASGKKKKAARDYVLTCLRLRLSNVYKIIQPAEFFFFVFGSV